MNKTDQAFASCSLYSSWERSKDIETGNFNHTVPYSNSMMCLVEWVGAGRCGERGEG